MKPSRQRPDHFKTMMEKYEEYERCTALAASSSKTIPCEDLLEWAIRHRILKGEAFKVQDRPYLPQIYRDKHQNIIVVKARQMEMTEYLVNWLLFNLTVHPDTTAIYTAPRADQVHRFSRDRIRKAIRESPLLRHNLQVAREEEGKEAITRIPFANGSLLYMYSGWGDFGGIRNIPADFAAVDEMQDVRSEALPVIMETMSHSKFRRLVLVGTASESGSEFDRLWQLSDQKEWNKEAQAWIPTKAENQAYSGYHLSQEMAIWITTLPPEHPNSIAFKRQTYAERRFLNEVLGLFYAGAAKPLLTEDLLRCRAFKLPMAEGLGPPFRSVMGVDWGGGLGSHTVVWIMTLDTWDRWRLLYVHRFVERDLMRQVDVISNLIGLFNVRQCVADLGYGAVQVSELQKRHAGTVLGCTYVQHPEKPIERKERQEFGERIVQYHVLADRSYYIEKAISLIKFIGKEGQPFPMLQLPWLDPSKVEWIVDQFTCIEREKAEMQSGRQYFRYVHPEGTEDDALHAFVYAIIADDATKMYGEFSMGDLFGPR